MIFLMGLLYLISAGDLFSQHCYRLSYDKNGNRVNFKIEDDFNEYIIVDDERGAVENIEPEEVVPDILVYPNPNDGKFKIEIPDDLGDEVTEVIVYDNKSVVLQSCCFVKETAIDISDNLPGIYLLRIVGNGYERVRVVVKH